MSLRKLRALAYYDAVAAGHFDRAAKRSLGSSEVYSSRVPWTRGVARRLSRLYQSSLDSSFRRRYRRAYRRLWLQEYYRPGRRSRFP